MPAATDPRSWFAAASAGFGLLLDALPPNRLDDPALGEWTVRDLLGHTCRAFLTVESYLAAAQQLPVEVPQLGTPQEYFRAAFAALGDPESVAARGVAAGRELGDEPLARAAQIRSRVTGVLDQSRDDQLVATPVGTMRLRDYLPTRAFELTAHSLDLAAALDIPPSAALEEAARPAAVLAVSLASAENAPILLRALTGRASLPAGFTVLGA